MGARFYKESHKGLQYILEAIRNVNPQRPDDCESGCRSSLLRERTHSQESSNFFQRLLCFHGTVSPQMALKTPITLDSGFGVDEPSLKTEETDDEVRYVTEHIKEQQRWRDVS